MTFVAKDEKARRACMHGGAVATYVDHSTERVGLCLRAFHPQYHTYRVEPKSSFVLVRQLAWRLVVILCADTKEQISDSDSNNHNT